MAPIKRRISDWASRSSTTAKRARTFTRLCAWRGFARAVRTLQGTLDDTNQEFELEVGKVVSALALPLTASTVCMVGVAAHQLSSAANAGRSFAAQGLGGSQRRKMRPISGEEDVMRYMGNLLDNVNNVALDLELGEEHRECSRSFVIVRTCFFSRAHLFVVSPNEV